MMVCSEYLKSIRRLSAHFRTPLLTDFDFLERHVRYPRWHIAAALPIITRVHTCAIF